jgi:hypothetical protein
MDYINGEELQRRLFKRTERYASNVRAIYMRYMNEIIELIKYAKLKEGVPFSFKEYGYHQIDEILRSCYSSVYQEIRGSIEKEWMLSNLNNDKLVKYVFGAKSLNDNHFTSLFKRNKEAMDAFFSRKGKGGFSLSTRVWKCTGRFKEELQACIDLALGEGVGANKLASKVKMYLNNSDSFYRRFKTKEGYVWKRRIFDKETNSYKWINDKPSKYHPGRGIYRSAYRNAQRLTRTETNMAYRTADYERWQTMDFVRGISIKLSNNHPVVDICDTLAGDYPKDFKWTGWHPNCYCYMVPLLATQDEIKDMYERVLSGEEVNKPSNIINECPKAFKTFLKDNQVKIELARKKGKLPYFIEDNIES